jgi:(p)ppGpp synthase/HD superfamily hydrolase
MSENKLTEGETMRRAGTIYAAIAFAVKKHCRDIDKAGRPGILHVLRVMHAVDDGSLSEENIEAMVSAVLHDTVEDTNTTIEEIEIEFGARIANVVSMLTRWDHETYMSYIETLSYNPIARKVKIADLKDNITRQDSFTYTEEAASLRKRYYKALAFLEGKQ